MDTKYKLGDQFIVMKKHNNAAKDHDKDRALILEITEVDLTYVMFDQPQYTLTSSNFYILAGGTVNEEYIDNLIANGEYIDDFQLEVIPQ